MSKIASFNLFKNEGDRASENTFRKFKEGGKDDVTASFFASNTEGTVVKGSSALKDVSQAGNPIVRVNVGIKTGETTVYYRGTLNVSHLKAEAIKSGQPNADKMPDYFGTATVKNSDVEYELAGWKVTTKADGTPAKEPYINVAINTPYEGKATTEAAPAPAAAAAGSNFDF
jgi:hypothetical protein